MNSKKYQKGFKISDHNLAPFNQLNTECKINKKTFEEEWCISEGT